MISVSRQNPLALYIQLKELIIDKIEGGEWKQGEMIPRELDLQQMYNVSRTTVRQALTELVFEGKLERIQGKGTFVAEKKLEPIRPELTGFTQDMEEKGHKVQSIILFKDIVVPNKKVQRILKLGTQDKVWKLDRIRLVDGLPIGYHETFINISLTPNAELDKYNFASESLYQALVKEEILLGDSEETVEANFPNEVHSKMLGIETPTPVLEIMRTSNLKDGRPYEFSNMVYRADKYKYSIKLKHQ
ncbi:GntR family transcriptional regulator [Virgibacillus necropolis]|nr:GntR family transcriptional regulator [Virgibacillus necropolis]